MKIAIIGYGVVGRNMDQLLGPCRKHDPQHGMFIADEEAFDLAFICVPTEELPTGHADCSIVDAVVSEWRYRATHLCIKSTVPPGTTYRYVMDGVSICMSPEYFGATQHANEPDYDFVIVGGTTGAMDAVAEAHKAVCTGDLRILKTSPDMAELVKYGENAWIATKLAFVHEWARICDHYGHDFDEWRELWLADPRINRSHTFTYRDHPFYDSHCLNKDVPAIIAACIDEGFVPQLLSAVHEVNESHREDGFNE